MKYIRAVWDASPLGKVAVVGAAFVVVGCGCCGLLLLLPNIVPLEGPGTASPTPALMELPTETARPGETTAPTATFTSTVAAATPTATSTATSTPTETPTPTSTPTETPTSTPTNTPTATPTPYTCDCSGDVYNCEGENVPPGNPQQCYDYCAAQGLGDIHGLDGDDDEIACE